MSPNIPPIGILALRLFIGISADPASWPKFEREYQARNNVTRSVSPQRIRPTHASHAVSSRLVTSVNNSNDRDWELDSMPTALPKRRVAQPRIASNTGATSVGDWLMTRRTSLIAVW